MTPETLAWFAIGVCVTYWAALGKSYWREWATMRSKR